MVELATASAASSESTNSAAIAEFSEGEIVFDPVLTPSFFVGLMDIIFTEDVATLLSVSIADDLEDPLSVPQLIFVVNVGDSVHTIGMELSRDDDGLGGISYILTNGPGNYWWKCTAEGGCDGCQPQPNRRRPTSCECVGGATDNPADRCKFESGGGNTSGPNTGWINGVTAAAAAIIAAIIASR